VVVNTANPGFCYSSLRSNLPFVVRLLTQLMELALARETKTGSSILVWASLAGTSGEVSPDLRDKQRGAYVSDWKVSEPSDFVLSDEGKAIGERLWVRIWCLAEFTECADRVYRKRHSKF
jgi:retinol dehydrogenase 12